MISPKWFILSGSLTCAFTLALFCCAVHAQPSEWEEVVRFVVQLRTIHQAAAHKTSFSRDIALLHHYVADAGSVSPPRIANWVGKVAELRRKYAGIDNPAAAAMATRPRVVISGAGPMGLLTAVLLVLRRGGHDHITILEKTDGKDTRWHPMVTNYELESLLTHDLGLKFPIPSATWIGQLPELEYVLGAMLLAVGVEIKYNTMFIFACPDTTDDSALVHTVDTPGPDSAVRHTTFDAAIFCAHNEEHLASVLEEMGIAREEQHVEAKVRVLIGADGVASSVRRSTLLHAGHSDPTSDASFPFLHWATASIFANNGDAGGFNTFQAKRVELYAADRQMEPLMTHLIVSFDPAGQEDAYDLYDNGLFFPADIPSAVTPQVDIRTLHPLFTEYGEKFTQEQFSSIVASFLPHHVRYIDERGNLRFRVYMEFLFRHQASAIFRAVFGGVLHLDRTGLDRAIHHAVQRILASIASIRSDRDRLRTVDVRHLMESAAAGVEEDVKLAQKLIYLIFKLLNMHSTFPRYRRSDDENIRRSQQYFDGDRAFPTFLRKLEHIKVFNQHVRGATSSALPTAAGKLKVILVGDAARDSYYIHGNSVNSAFTALSQHLDGLFTHSGPEFAESARAYHAQLVDQFVNFIGAGVYFRCFCGCGTSADLRYLKQLVFTDIVCNDGHAACPFPKTLSSDHLRLQCSTQNATLFEDSLQRHFCDATALQLQN